MAWYRNLRMLYKILIPVAVALTLALGGLTWQIRSMTAAAVQRVAERELAALAGQYGNEVRNFFDEALNRAQALADALGQAVGQNTPVAREAQIAMLRGVLEGNADYLGLGVAWEPNAMGADSGYANAPGSDAAGRFIPYVTRGGTELLADLETSDYYKLPKERNRSTLIEPFFYEVGGKRTLMTTASAAIKTGGVFLGGLFVDIPLGEVSEMVSAIKVYTSGGGSILTQNGAIIAHRNLDLTGKNFFEARGDDAAPGLLDAMRAGRPFLEASIIGGKDYLHYYYPIHFKTSGQFWYFAVSAPRAEVLAEVAAISNVTLGASLATLLLALAIIFLAVRFSVRPLAALAGGAKRIADGDLNVVFDGRKFGGEMGELADSLGNMITSLLASLAEAEKLSEAAREQTAKAEASMREAEAARSMAESKRESILEAASRLEGVVHIVASASEQLSAQIDQSERGSVEQAHRVGEAADAMSAMNSAVLDVARSAGAASDVTLHAKSKAAEGAHVVQEAVAGIQDVQAVSLALKDDMGKLAEQGDAIAGIMGVISDIADQTNLLALNAAIEAARAGEAGRGFAVVADEVRKLAEKTMVSTKNVGSAVVSIQSSVTQSIAQVDRAVSLIESATGQANRSGAALAEIVDMVENAADQVRAIAAASEEQSATSEQISHTFHQVSGIADETAQGMRHAAQAVAELVGQVQKLNALIEDMKRD